MILVVLYGDADDAQIGKELSAILACHGGVLHIRSSQSVHHSPDGGQTDFVLYECDTAPRFETEKGIFVFKNKISRYAGLKVPKGWLAVVDAGNVSALSVLQKSGISAVTCGMSAKDTLNLSSSKEFSAVVSFQRQMYSLSGQEVYEQDVPVRLEKEMDPYVILSACAVLALADRQPQDTMDIF